MKSLLNAVFSTLLITAPALAQDSLSPQMPQTRAGTGETIVDSKGAIVGKLIGLDTAERFIGDQWVTFTVLTPGFYSFYTGPGSLSDNPLFFASTDCSGQTYMQAQDIPIRAQVVVAGTPTKDGYYPGATLYFAGKPFSFVVVASRKNSPSSSCLLTQGGATMGPVKTFTFPTFVPPFTVR